MIILERQNKVLQYVQQKRVATVGELAAFFKVHEATIRRDLSTLEKKKKLRRTHGGVIVENEVDSEPAFLERKTEQLEEKRRIGKKAAEFIEDGDNIILDSGTTTVHIVDEIIKKKNITVITNDINVSAKLSFATDIKVFVTGGMLFPDSYMLNGMITDEVLNNLYVHKAFIGTPAFHHNFGLTHYNENLVSAKKAMIRSAKEVFVVTDHTKIDKISIHKVAHIKEIDVLITSENLKDKQKDSLNELNIDVIFV